MKAGSSGLSAVSDINGSNMKTKLTLGVQLQAGWTGACVTLAVVGIILGAASFFGVIFFKKPARGQAIHLNKRGAHQLDDDISVRETVTSLSA